MSTLKQLLLSPIRFYPSLLFGSATVFQNPDNRVSHGYNWDGVNSLPYALPIPRQWPDGQPGIDFMINAVEADGTFYADLYDSDDAKEISIHVYAWKDLGTDIQYRVFYDCSGISDGYYTIKLFQTADDALLLESEPLLIAEWFDDMIPLEYSNFENDFGIVYDDDDIKWTGRVMVPVKIFDPSPQFEKEVYKDDPGTLTTLRSTVQRVFNFESMPVPVHLAELFSMTFANSELYLDRMKVNSEAAPESELIEGTNLKQLSGTATLVDFNDEYTREKVETTKTDQSADWGADSYTNGSSSGSLFTVNDPAPIAAPSGVISDDVTYVDDDIILVKVDLTDLNNSDFPYHSLASSAYKLRFKEWGVNWIAYQMSGAGTFNFYIRNDIPDVAKFTAELTIYKLSK